MMMAEKRADTSVKNTLVSKSERNRASDGQAAKKHKKPCPFCAFPRDPQKEP
jgi:hypothetical protein